MIDAKELRIGNYVYQQSLKVIPANFINKQIVVIDLISEEIFPNDISNQYAPIPLTEEILLRCGAYVSTGTKGNIYSFELMDGIEIEYDEVNKGFAVVVGETLVTIVYHLHKLQNILYEIEGEELEFKS